MENRYCSVKSSFLRPLVMSLLITRVKENIAKFIVLLLSVCAGILLVSCITAIDGSLPYQELPVLTVGTEFNLVASPAHPTSYLSNDAVAAGETV